MNKLSPFFCTSSNQQMLVKMFKKQNENYLKQIRIFFTKSKLKNCGKTPLAYTSNPLNSPCTLQSQNNI